MKIIFDTQNIYYVPQYYPIYLELLLRGFEAEFVCYENKNSRAIFAKSLDAKQHWVSDEEEAQKYYSVEKPDWIFFGNKFEGLGLIHQFSNTAQLGHGIGPKPSYYRKSDTPMTIRFMEGLLRLNTIKKMYPDDKFIQVGYSKLDPLFDGSERGLDLEQFGLDSRKKTLLYAPTFNPSSIEAFPDDWPDDFKDCNVLIKPHTFSYTRKKYKAHREKFRKWDKFNNCYVANEKEFSLLPFLKTSDVLISEASSTLFEFIAMDKPVVVANFFKLKWSYRGIFKKRFKKRFMKDNVLYKDIGPHVSSYKEIKPIILNELKSPESYRERRRQYSIDHVGPTDGKVSKRIVDYLVSNRP